LSNRTVNGHLHALGHRDIIYLTGPDNYSNATRQRAFRKACQRLQITATELGPFAATFSSGVRAADLGNRFQRRRNPM
jgi:DNA-binding LacI/PurR family transcriptional regulator